METKKPAHLAWCSELHGPPWRPVGIVKENTFASPMVLRYYRCFDPLILMDINVHRRAARWKRAKETGPSLLAVIE